MGQRDSTKGVRFKVSKDARYFTDEKGEPFFYLADTAWAIFRRLNHEDVDLYLKNRVSKGFTVIQAYVLRGLKVPNLYGHLPLTNDDPAHPNEAFFENVDYVVNRANDLGLVMGLVTSWGEHVTHDSTRQHRRNEQVFDTSNAFAYGHFLGDRYRKNGVMWLLGGDWTPANSKDVWAAMP